MYYTTGCGVRSDAIIVKGVIPTCLRKVFERIYGIFVCEGCPDKLNEYFLSSNCGSWTRTLFVSQDALHRHRGMFEFSLGSEEGWQFIYCIKSNDVTHNSVSAKVLKLILLDIGLPLTHVLNHIDSRKMATITTIRKKSAQEKVLPQARTGPRPISILPPLSKLLERSMIDQIRLHLT